MNTCTCNKHRGQFRLNDVLQMDPTRTMTLRRRFVADMNKRFNALKKDIRKSIVDLDCFGLTHHAPLVLEATAPGQFAFMRSGDKVAGFMRWLDEQEEAGILQTSTRISGFPRAGAEAAWTDVYIESAYQRGITRGRAELRAAGYPVPGFEGVGPGETVGAAFNQPFHVDRVGLAYVRTFSELKGITRAMDQQISRVLAEGLAEGRGPREIARLINDRVDKIGITRARTLARTEVIRAHHVANIQEYRAAGALGVTVKAEWATASFNVCAICADLEGQVFELDKIEGMLPAHPNCRCVALPVPIGEEI